MGLGGGSGVIDLVELSKDANGNFSVRGRNERITSIDAVGTECLFPLFLENAIKGNKNRERYGLYVMQNHLEANAYFRIFGEKQLRTRGRCNEIIQFYRIETEEAFDGKSV